MPPNCERSGTLGQPCRLIRPVVERGRAGHKVDCAVGGGQVLGGSLDETKPLIGGRLARDPDHLRCRVDSRQFGGRGQAVGQLPEVWRSVFFIVVTIIAVAAITVLIMKTHERFSVYAFSLIAGGAVGNVIDRIRYGEVVDFIQWYVKSHYWPSFNVADSAISIGVALLAVEMLFGKQQKQTQQNDK
jgi:hypothetical protein